MTQRHSLGSKPLVFESCQAHHVLQFCMQHASPSKHLIVGSSRDKFLHDLMDELRRETSQPSLLESTLTNIHHSRNIRITFCPDLANLQAYLSALPHLDRSDVAIKDECNPIAPLLVFLNPIRLHEPTLSFSAQGFNRTFATAVETAHHMHCHLIVVESDMPRHGHADDHEGDVDILSDGEPTVSPWDQEVSMLNITTKTFGTGERGWVGRAVKIRRIAERWFTFSSLDEHGGNLS